MIQVCINATKQVMELEKVLAECQDAADKFEINRSNIEIKGKLLQELVTAERKAWDALARYKFWMFGYWAAIWVHLNRIGEFGLSNPWSELVRIARQEGYESKEKGGAE